MSDKQPLKCPGCGRESENRVGEALFQETKMPLYGCPGCETEFVVTPDGQGIIIPDITKRNRIKLTWKTETE